MKINKTQEALVKSFIRKWEHEGVIDSQQAQKMNNSYEVAGFDWQNLAFIAFFFAIICIILAVSLLLADQWLMHVLESLVASSTIYKILFFVILSAGAYLWAYSRSRKYPHKIYSNEGFYLLGAATTSVSLVYIAFALGNATENYSFLVLIAALIYGGIGIGLESKINWILALVGIGCWYGAFTFGDPEQEPFFLGMNIPVRFIPLGILMAVSGYLVKDIIGREEFYWRSTFMGGMLYLFTALWLVTIFGNYGNLTLWYEIDHIHLVHWSIVFGIITIIFIYLGLKWEENILRDLGLIYLLLNLYTRYFEFFWERLHISIFFLVLGLSFWLIGKQAEKLWQKSG